MRSCSEKFVESGGTGVPPEHQMRRLLRPAPPNFSLFRMSPGLIITAWKPILLQSSGFAQKPSHPEGKLLSPSGAWRQGCVPKLEIGNERKVAAGFSLRKLKIAATTG